MQSRAALAPLAGGARPGVLEPELVGLAGGKLRVRVVVLGVRWTMGFVGGLVLGLDLGVRGLRLCAEEIGMSRRDNVWQFCSLGLVLFSLACNGSVCW